ncbi:hypothetical protein [Streptomyces sp. NPDC057910]|uniref:hypothetical protein n=1 Tax=Streptomyces sp. NPDC057910 TaxID=3346278 RepID=UPI0036E78463
MFKAADYWPGLAHADHLHQQEPTYSGPNPDYRPGGASLDPGAYGEEDWTPGTGGAGTGPVGSGAEAEWEEDDAAVWAPEAAVLEEAPDAPGLAPRGADHTAQRRVRTVCTQTELAALLDGPGLLVFTPAEGSDLTVSGQRAELCGPGVLSAVTGGSVTAVGDACISTVTGGQVHCCDDARIVEVSGGNVTALDWAAIDTVTGGWAHAGDDATIGTVSGGEVGASDDAAIGTVSGGEVQAADDAEIGTVSGGEVSAIDRATIHAVSGGTVTAAGRVTVAGVTGGTVIVSDNVLLTADNGYAWIIARGNAYVTIGTGAEGVHVDAYDSADITAGSGTVAVHSPEVKVTADDGVTVSRAYFT